MTKGRGGCLNRSRQASNRIFSAAWGETQVLSVLTGVVVFIAGALVGGAVNALVDRYAVFKESKGVALAIKAEIDALVMLATFRNYIRLTDAMIERLKNPSHIPTAADVFLVPITQDYFSVFHALSPKLGLLGLHASNVVLAYAATKSLFEDLALLRDQAQPVLEGKKTVAPNDARAFLLEMTTQINGLLRSAVSIATNTSDALGTFGERRWLWLFS